MDGAEIEALLDGIAVYEQLHREVSQPCADPFSETPCRLDDNRLGAWRQWVRL